jgi:hypothetical protein
MMLQHSLKDIWSKELLLSNIYLGDLKTSTGRLLSLFVFFDDNGLFQKFNVSSSKGSLDIGKWEEDCEGKSEMPMLNELCIRFDVVISINNSIIDDLPVKMSDLNSLKRVGVELGAIKNIDVKLKGRSFYKVIYGKKVKVKPPKPPCREDFSSHHAFRDALDSYMNMTKIIRARMASDSQSLDFIVVSEMEKDTYFTYSPKLAEYAFLSQLDS